MEWDYSGRKGRDGQKKKIGKANERKGKVKRGKDEEVNGQGHTQTFVLAARTSRQASHLHVTVSAPPADMSKWST